MNVNLPPLTLAINDWLDDATHQLRAIGIKSARLDAEIILAHTLRQPRTFLHSHADEILTDREREIADARLLLRLDRVPIAYIIGHKEFYGRRFKVSTATLIPRPESETMITLLKEIVPNNITLLSGMTKRLVDVGTGSGNLGITAKLTLSELDVTLLDISKHALKIASENAERLHAKVTLLQSDLLRAYPFEPDIILANLPYVDPTWERSPETDHEPAVALFAEDEGQALIKKLIDQASTRLTPGGLLFIEADPTQHSSFTRYAVAHHFHLSITRDYIVVYEKLT